MEYAWLNVLYLYDYGLDTVLGGGQARWKIMEFLKQEGEPQVDVLIFELREHRRG